MNETIGAEIDRHRSAAKTVARWGLALLGVPIMSASWIWLTLASTEQAEETAKAPPGDTSTAGLFVALGVVPLVIVHLLGVVILRSVAARDPAHQGRDWVFAGVLVVLSSGIGLTVALIINGGVLLTPVNGGYSP